jgi:NADH dehydrogenase
MSSLFITGLTGFVGRALRARLESERPGRPILSLQRAPSGEVPGSGASARTRIVTGDLGDVTTWETALAGAKTVVHLAARTGKASRELHFETNAEGTRRLLEAARRSGVEHLLFVSTIAATYPDKRSYPYAASKERAEELVRESGLRHAILRPTIVLGPGSPIGATLRGLAKAPFLPVFGDGRTRIQPVHVDDVVSALLLLVDRLESGAIVEGTFDLGGPEALSFEDFLLRLARAVRGSDPKVVHLPVRAMIAVLSALEPMLLPVLPVTAGQLSAFVHDGVAEAVGLWDELPAPRRGVDEMVAELAGDA